MGGETNGTILPSQKKDDKRNYGNYKGITLTTVLGTAIARILEKKGRGIKSKCTKRKY